MSPKISGRVTTGKAGGEEKEKRKAALLGKIPYYFAYLIIN